MPRRYSSPRISRTPFRSTLEAATSFVSTLNWNEVFLEPDYAFRKACRQFRITAFLGHHYIDLWVAHTYYKETDNGSTTCPPQMDPT